MGTHDDTSANYFRFYILEKLLFVLIGFDVCGELWQLGRMWADTGSALKYFHSLWNILDWLNLVFFITMFTTRGYVSGLLSKYRLGGNFRYDVYHDLGQDARWLQIRNESGRPASHPILAYGNFKDYHGLDKDIVFYRELQDATSILSTQYLLCTLTMLVRFIKVLDFQPKLALVSKTIEKAAGPLSYFSIVFVTIVLGFSLCAHLVFGNICSSFADLPSSIMTCFNIFLGDIGVNEEMMNSTMMASWLLFLVCYLLITFFVLLNILLAIIVDAYVEVKDSAASHNGVYVDLKNVIKNAAAKCKGQPTIQDIIPALDKESRAKVDNSLKANQTKKNEENGGEGQTKVVPLNNNNMKRRGQEINEESSALELLEDHLDDVTQAISVEHNVGDGKTITFPLTLDFLMTAFGSDPIWRSTSVDGKDAVKQMHKLLSKEHKGVGKDGLEDVKLAAVHRSMSAKVLQHLKSRADRLSMLN